MSPIKGLTERDSVRYLNHFGLIYRGLNYIKHVSYECITNQIILYATKYDNITNDAELLSTKSPDN